MAEKGVVVATNESPSWIEELLKELSNRQLKVLLVLAAGEMAGREVLGREDAAWMVSFEVDSGDVLALNSALGPPPYEPPLYRTLGDLVEVGLVTQDAHGFSLTDAEQVLANLQVDYGNQLGELADRVKAAPN